MSFKEKQKQYNDIAKAVLHGVGGKENIQSVTHCVTRLRFILKDESIPDDESLKQVKGVIGVNRAAGQYQVIIGQTVDKVYDAVCKIGNLEKNAPINENLDVDLTQIHEKLSFKSIGSLVLNKLAGCLTPLIPMLIAGAMFKMVIAVFGPTMLNLLSTSSDTYKLFTFVGDAAFYFLPIMIGYTASKQFHTSTIVSMFLGAILVHPNLINIVTVGKPFWVFGIPMSEVNYSATIIPIILSIWAMSYVERFFKRFIPVSLSTILVPTLTIVVMLPITLCLLGPAGGFLGTYICDAILAFGKLGGIWSILGIAIIGAVWELLVMTGMHWVIISAVTMLIAQNGFDNFATLGSVAASLSVAGMCLGAALRFKEKDQRALAWSYLIASLVGGVTEPALYGLAVPYKRPFIGMMIGGFVGGLYAGIVHIAAYVMVPVASFMSLTAYTHTTSNLINGIISGIIAFFGAAIATYLIGVESNNSAPVKLTDLKPVEA